MARRKIQSLGVANAVTAHFQRARCGYTGVKLPKTASGSIAGIDESFFIGGFGLLVEGFETGTRYVHFAANLNHRRG